MEVVTLDEQSEEGLISLVKRQQATIEAYAKQIARLEKALKETNRVVYTTNPYIAKDKQLSLFD